MLDERCEELNLGGKKRRSEKERSRTNEIPL